MENREIARLLRQTADLMEVAGEDSFRVRSYRKGADTIDGTAERVESMQLDPKRLLALPGIGKTLCENILEILRDGKLGYRDELLARYKPEMLELLQVSGLGPKTIALIWNTYGAGSLNEVEALAQQGKLRTLPRLGAKAEEKIARAIATYRQLSGRFRRDQVEEIIELVRPVLAGAAGVERLEFTGSYRRGCETIGDLDAVVTGKGFPVRGGAVVQAFTEMPRVVEIIGKGENKSSVRLHGGLQADLRVVPPESWGAALQYFTGSKQHNVSLRQRAQRLGFKLNEYGLIRESDGKTVAGADEAGVYQALGLSWIPPELREEIGEIALAENLELPKLIEEKDIRGDVHMHTTETDGRFSIEEMAAAAAAKGYQYIAITDHSQALAMANGLNEERALKHLARIRAAEKEFQKQHRGFRIFAGIEVDILADGRLDLKDDVLRQLDIVIGSVHSRFELDEKTMTERISRAVANPNLDVLGHPTGRLLLRREAYRYDFERILQEVAKAGVAMEINASPERLDLNDGHARLCRQLGIPIVINTDAHHTKHLANIRYGLAMARRAGLTANDVLNTRPADGFLASLRDQRTQPPAQRQTRGPRPAATSARD